VVNIVLNLLLMGPMGHAGLALATSLASGVNLIMLARLFSLESGPGWFDRGLKREIFFSCIAGGLMLLVTGALAAKVNWMELDTLNRVAYLIGCVGLGIGVYSVAAWVFGCKGMKTLTNKLFKRT
jgi:putative peptidoglycan lipid II flippase